MKKAILTLAIAAALILTLGLSACKTDGRQAEGGKFDELTTAAKCTGSARHRRARSFPP